MKNKKVLLGMSGGVDSSVSALLLKKQGYEVVGTTLDLFCQNNEENSHVDAEKMCKTLEIPYYIYDCKEEFKNHVIEDFINCYADCKTPNPCIECNKYMKFGFMWEKAKELGCDYIATGHYAKTEYSEKYQKWVLKKSNAGKKDQSYVLWNISKDLIEHILFPLSDFAEKDEIREIARENNLKVANKPDSEDICFVPDGNYKKFLENNSDIKPKKGNIVTSNGEVLGKHTGLYNYTIGQRKGLGISYKVPLFVLGFNKAKNEVIVGEEKELYKKEITVTDINLLLVDEIKETMEVEVKTRYSSKVAKAKITQEENIIKVVFDEPQRAITPGQSAVFYIDDIVLGGGKNKMLNQFSRTELLIGKEGLEKLQNSKVAVFGIGGVGSYVAEGLARAGVGHIVLVDFDKVDITNINRQIEALHSNIGRYKTEVMKERILDINPNAVVEVYRPDEIDEGEENLIDKSYDYVVDAIDTMPNKIKLIEKASQENIRIISATGTGNKMDPTRFEISDIYKTSVCPVCKILRKELKKKGIYKLKVVYSKEEPIKPQYDKTAKEKTIGSISFVPSVAGLIIAGEVIKDLINA